MAASIKLKRCLIGGREAIIIRPENHKTEPGYGHGKAYLEIMSPVHLRNTLKLGNDDVVDVQIDGDEHWWKSGI